MEPRDFRLTTNGCFCFGVFYTRKTLVFEVSVFKVFVFSLHFSLRFQKSLFSELSVFRTLRFAWRFHRCGTNSKLKQKEISSFSPNNIVVHRLHVYVHVRNWYFSCHLLVRHRTILVAMETRAQNTLRGRKVKRKRKE